MRHFTPQENTTPAQCLRILDALGLEGWQEGEHIFALEPIGEGIQLASFAADGHGLRAFLQSLEPAQCAA